MCFSFLSASAGVSLITLGSRLTQHCSDLTHREEAFWNISTPFRHCQCSPRLLKVGSLWQHFRDSQLWWLRTFQVLCCHQLKFYNRVNLTAFTYLTIWIIVIVLRSFHEWMVTRSYKGPQFVFLCTAQLSFCRLSSALWGLQCLRSKANVNSFLWHWI